MNKNYDLTWDVKRLGSLSLINRTVNYNWSLSPQTRTYTLPAYYKDLDYITVEVNATWTTSNEATTFEGGPLASYGLQADFESPSIAISGGTNSTYLNYMYSRNNTYSAVNPWATGTYPLDPSLPWKDVSYSVATKSFSGSFKAIIPNPYKNNTKDTYLHGDLSLAAWEVGASSATSRSPITYNIDGNVLSTYVEVPYQYSLSLTIKMVGHGVFDI